MAITVQSVGVSGTDFASGTSCVITKPSGLAEGDLMVAVLGNTVGDFANADWTSILVGLPESGNTRMETFYKIADADDVAASNFTFTCSSGSNAGFILRITGHNASSPVLAGSLTDNVTNDQTPTYNDMSVTPSYANSLLIYPIFIYGGNTAGQGISGYAIATDNPTWTERGEIINSAGGTAIAVATATRSAITATGNATAVLDDNDGDENSIAEMIVINPIQDATITPLVIDIVASVQAPTIKVGVVLTPSVVTITTSIQAPSVKIRTEWANQDKSSAPTWANQDKSTT